MNIDLFKGSRKVNGVAEVCNLPVLVKVQVLTGKQLHSELVRTTILKDFAEFEGISKCVYVWFLLSRYVLCFMFYFIKLMFILGPFNASKRRWQQQQQQQRLEMRHIDDD